MKAKYVSFDRRLLENFSWPLALSALGLAVCGLVNLYSISLSHPPESGLSEFGKQLLFCGGGVALCLAALCVDYRILKRVALPLFGIGVGLLLMVEFFGVVAGGARRWLDIASFRFQPSEFMKPALVILLAALFSAKEFAKKGLTLATFPLPAVLTLVPVGLVLKEPDLGTAGLLGFTALPIFLYAAWSRALKLAVAALAAAALSWIFLFGGLDFLLAKEIIHPYQLERVLTHSNPEEDYNGKGWQIIQSKRAIGSGQILGRGFHDGTQQKYGFLPAPNTDFAFAALAEEWGFVGCCAVIALYYTLLCSALGVVRRCRDLFGKYLALGLSSLIFCQMAINIAMVTGLFPVVGIPLPFVSYGGTSLLVSLLAAAGILNIGMRRYLFQDATVIENRKAWEEGQAIALKERIPAVRRLTPPAEGEPDVFPDYRRPHVKPWLKYVGRRSAVRPYLRDSPPPDPRQPLQ
ncbi:MAG: rod shape-determining protein RodA [Deltaproteobacteria bacterium]|nr:rod shape-determining protein RodA [Deltaproteobacteria bacterium]